MLYNQCATSYLLIEKIKISHFESEFCDKITLRQLIITNLGGIG